MILKELKAHGIRNLVECDLTQCDPEKNVFLGDNGQGKTSVLESIYFLTTLKSFRTHHLDEMVRYGGHEAGISGKIQFTEKKEAEIWDYKIQISKPGEKFQKKTFIQNHACKKVSEYLSQNILGNQYSIHSVIFNPADHDLVRGDPQGRRNYLDRVLSAQNLNYAENLKRYQKALFQRNYLLKDPQGHQKQDLLDTYTETLCMYGTWITEARLEWLNRNSALFNSHAKKLTFSRDDLHFQYFSTWLFDGDDIAYLDGQNLEKDEIHQRLTLDFKKNRFREKEAKITLSGPHRDDWGIRIGKMLLKGHGSQGEIRTALLSLKLTEVESHLRETGTQPLFLLDDFSSELDEKRRTSLLNFLEELSIQVWITTTEKKKFLGKVFWVRDGKVLPEIE